MGVEVKNKWSAWLRLESEIACHIVDDGEPGGDGLDPFDASNRELLEAAIARLGVDTLCRRCPLLVDLLGLGRPHPLAPLRHFFTVSRFRLMPINPFLLR